ncbi:hypothetical protein MTR62_02640 [Novosphingobium sp. 1949]|uniref:Uncharacterized protein n=1 Tax=Novosphingobium organovorum TaxID=2930092 RepID=A0ABT0B969_9SPHN|nr:hypothetical protein [Novosphingobium organovorum]MCJ2181612.1 hypothetical protein [Novosphingobium organovorum]
MHPRLCSQSPRPPLTRACAASPRLPLDPSLRRLFYGPIRPMDEPGLLGKLARALRRQ